MVSAGTIPTRAKKIPMRAARRPYCFITASAALTRSGVNGTSRMRAPVASKIALPIAGGDDRDRRLARAGRLGRPVGRSARSRSPARRTRAAGCGTCASRSRSPSRSSQVTSSPSARLMPCSAPPSIWLLHPVRDSRSARSPARRRSASPSPGRCRDRPRPRRPSRRSRCRLRTPRTTMPRPPATPVARRVAASATAARPISPPSPPPSRTSLSRGSLRCRSRNATGSAFTCAATSSMNALVRERVLQARRRPQRPGEERRRAPCATARARSSTVPAPPHAPPTQPAT